MNVGFYKFTQKFKDFWDGLNESFDGWFQKNMPGFASLWNKTTGSELTNAEREANSFTAAEAEKQRVWETEMSNTSYQRMVADMSKAGVNPAMAMNSASGASTPSGAAATSVSPNSGASLSDIMQLFMMPLQRKLINSQARMYKDQGEAALINAGAAVRNAGAAERNAGTNERNAATNERNAATNERAVSVSEVRNSIERMVAESNVKLNEQQINKMAADIAYINETTNYISKNYALAVKDADSRAKSAMAMLKSADAAFQNALTNEYLSNYQADLYSTQVTFNELVSKEKEIDISFLPEKTQAQIYELRERGYYFNQQGKLVDKQGKLVDAQTAETYTRMAVEAVHEACEVVNTATQFIPRAKIGF